MPDSRIRQHPILPVSEGEMVTFYWKKKPLSGKKDEMLSSALIANGIDVFSRHTRDHAPQGIYCANGQCSKCMVIANGMPVKSCMTPVRANMFVESADGLPKLPDLRQAARLKEIEEKATDVLIIGAGPAGLSAALELGKLGIRTLLVDDKNEPGGKLVLQTHKFFGSVEDSQAGTRGNRIGKNLAEEVGRTAAVEVWLNSTAIFVFKDKKVGILKDGVYKLVAPRLILNAAGAREKFLRFAGNHLVGVYGAGAFQTLVNRDLVRSASRIFVIGGGNVGLIASYHALQAGIWVVGLAEALPQCGGYLVHADKLKRLGVPIYTSHTILSANGKERVESITIARVDADFNPIPGTEKSFSCDTILIAVGLDSINEFAGEAEKAGIPVFAAGDAAEIAEASSAMFNGRIAGLQAARRLGAPVGEVPATWYQKAEVLKAHPGKVVEQKFPAQQEGVMPLIHCLQEIPCNPCITVCPTHSIIIKGDQLLGLPEYEGSCSGCSKCVAICPGLAITLVDCSRDRAFPEVTVPYEVFNFAVKKGEKVQAVDIHGNLLGEMEVTQVVFDRKNKTQFVRIKAPALLAKKVVSFRIQPGEVSQQLAKAIPPEKRLDEANVCLCERVQVSEVRDLIRKGITDLNQIKAITRAGMGACGAKTCENLIKQIFREEGIPLKETVPNTQRPLFVEVPLGVLAGADTEGEES